MRVRLNGWQRIGIVLSLLWGLSVSLWFLLHVPQPSDPGVASVYLQCISEPNANRDVCQGRAEWFGKEARSEFRAAWSSIILAPILALWALIYIVVWTARWIRRGFQATT
jgi:hypothetical protein